MILCYNEFNYRFSAFVLLVGNQNAETGEGKVKEC